MLSSRGERRRSLSVLDYGEYNEFAPSAPPRLSDPSWPLHLTEREGEILPPQTETAGMSHSFGASNYRHSHPRAKSRSERQPQQAAPPSRFEFDEDHLEEKGRPKSSSAAVRTRSMPLHQRTQTHVLFDEMIHSARRIVSVPSDREKVRTTTRIVNLASDYLNRKKAASGALITEQNLPYSPQLKAIPREHLSYLVRQRENGAWQATVSLAQPHVRGNYTDPQGTRPGHITIGFYATEEGALAAARHNAPPVWAKPCKGGCCSVCRDEIKSYKSPSHCRNCGKLVCSKCSKTRWPGGMLPATYHNNESSVRICDLCKQLSLEFKAALKDGAYDRALELYYETDNVNVWTPYLLDSKREYPVHMAAEGGSLKLLRWLVEELSCPLYDAEEAPLLTHLGDSVLGVAARFNRLRIMRWLVKVKKCKIREITDLHQLWQALESLLCEDNNKKASKHSSVNRGGEV